MFWVALLRLLIAARDDVVPRFDGAPVLSPGPAVGVLIGYARCLTDKQDLAAQRHTLRQLGVSDDRVYLDHGMTGRHRHRHRPGLQQALAAVREGDALVVPRLDRLARSVPDARAIGDSRAGGGVRLSVGGTVYDPNDPMGKMCFNILATFAEFEVDLLRMRTREGMAIARANGRPKGKAPKLSARQRVHVLALAHFDLVRCGAARRGAARRAGGRREAWVRQFLRELLDGRCRDGD